MIHTTATSSRQGDLMVWPSVFNSKLTKLLQPTTVPASTAKKLPTSQLAGTRVANLKITTGPRTTPLPMITSAVPLREMITHQIGDTTVWASGCFNQLTMTRCQALISHFLLLLGSSAPMKTVARAGVLETPLTCSTSTLKTARWRKTKSSFWQAQLLCRWQLPASLSSPRSWCEHLAVEGGSSSEQVTPSLYKSYLSFSFLQILQSLIYLLNSNLSFKPP